MASELLAMGLLFLLVMFVRVAASQNHGFPISRSHCITAAGSLHDCITANQITCSRNDGNDVRCVAAS